jgi:hypothetical protein
VTSVTSQEKGDHVTTTNTAGKLLCDIVEDAAQVADTLGLHTRFRAQPRQLTVYGVNYDGTDRSSRLSKKADKVRVTDYGTYAVILTLTGNNARVAERQIHAETEPDREGLTDLLSDILGEVA